MKTLQELYSEVLKSEELKKGFAEAVRNGTAADFLKAHGCEASGGDLEAFLKEQQARTRELSDDELDSVSGGCNDEETIVSSVTLGIGCVGMAIKSASQGRMKGDDGRILCGDSDDTQYDPYVR